MLMVWLLWENERENTVQKVLERLEGNGQEKWNINQQMQKKSHNLVSKEAQSYKSIASASACQCDSSQSISLVIKEK